MKGVLPWLVRWLAMPVLENFCPALAALVGPVQNIFPHRTLFHFICPHRPATWSGSQAASPVSQYVSGYDQRESRVDVGRGKGQLEILPTFAGEMVWGSI